MLKRLILLLMINTFTLATASAGSIMVLGDSISAAYGMQPEEGWVHLLEQQLQDDHKVINASVSGETSGGGLHRLDALLKTHTPDLVIIELGGNDGLRGYPLTGLQKNLETMIENTHAANSKVLLVGMQIPPNYGPRYSQQFAALYPQLADRHQIPLIPNFLQSVATDSNLMQNDGIHPNQKAQPQLMEKVLRVLQVQFKNL